MDRTSPAGILHMLENQLLCDVTFTVGVSKEEVKAHRVILASTSVVFEAMFCRPLTQVDQTIDVPDIEPNVMMDLFRYLYGKELDLHGDTVVSLGYAAKKYAVDQLYTNCIHFLEMSMNNENVLPVLQTAYIFDEKCLFEKCLSFVYTHSYDVFLTPGLSDISQEVVEFLTKPGNASTGADLESLDKMRDVQDKLNVCELNTDFPLGLVKNLLFLVRMPFVPFSMFLNIVAPCNVKNGNDTERAINALCSNEMCRDAFFRQHVIKKQMVFLCTIEKSLAVDPSSFFLKTNHAFNETFTFSCSQNISLVGFSLFTPVSRGKCTIDLDVMDTAHVSALGKLNPTLVYQTHSDHSDVLFSKPIDIADTTDYVVTLVGFGIETHLGTYVKDVASIDELLVSFRSRYHSDGTSMSQIRGMLLYKS